MHIANVTKTIQWGPMQVPPSTYYLEDHNAAELMWASRGFGGITLQPAEWAGIHASEIEDDSELFVSRVGGFGDLLWLNAIYQMLKSERDIKITHCCFPRYASILLGFVDHVVSYPLHEKDAPCNQRVWLENIVEATPCTNGEHPCDRMASRFGLDPLPIKSAYKIFKPEEQKASNAWPRTANRRVCIQTASSTGNKSYPHIPDVVELAYKEGWEILLVGDPRKSKEQTPPGVFDCTQRNMDIRESIAMAGQCDLIIASDSVFIHVAEALNIPCIGIFGPFDGQTYLQGHGWVLQGRLKCSPCHWHPRGTPFPTSGPCSTTGVCEAIAMIDPREVISKARKFL